jgi:steroid delta-isomerase-like uncharacterized protein
MSELAPFSLRLSPLESYMVVHTMTAQAHVHRNHEIVERAFTEILDGHDLDLIPELYAEDCAFYGMSGPEPIDRDEYEAFLSTYFEAFPDLSFEIEETIDDDDRVAVRWTAYGTHEGDLMDVLATGKSATVPGMSFIRLEDGMIVEAYNSQDMLGLLQQIDAIPDSPRKIVRLMIGQLRGRLADR